MDAQNPVELEFGLIGESLLQLHHPQDEPASPKDFEVDPRLDAVALRPSSLHIFYHIFEDG